MIRVGFVVETVSVCLVFSYFVFSDVQAHRASVFSSQSEITPICERTQEVQDAIVMAFFKKNCNDVTLENLRSIHILQFQGRGIEELKPGDFSGLSSLWVLDLSENNLSVLPDDLFSQNTHLKLLNLSRNPLGTPPNLSENPELEHLILKENKNLQSPPDVSRNPLLVELSLQGSQLKGSPPDVSNNFKLRVLDLSGNEFSHFPDISNNPQLRTFKFGIEETSTLSLPDTSKNPLLETIEVH